MPAASDLYLSLRRDAGSRAVSLALSLALVALIVLALLGLGASPGRLFGDRPLATFDVTEAARTAEAPPEPARPQTRAAERTAPPPPTDPVEPPPEFPPEIIRLSRSDYARWAVAPRSAPRESADAGEASADAGSTARVGTGPNGQPLYAADWYREPSRAEMSTYLGRTRPGWGTIACKTAPRYRVVDCVELAESPGSGISGALRQAAWQFLVLPPRIGGKPMIGEWVRIRFDLTVDKAG